jgi:hypothetical protein
MDKMGWGKFTILKVFQFFNIDLLNEIKELQDTVFKLKEDNNNLNKQISSEMCKHISERDLPPGFARRHNNLLIAPDNTMYCWNCYNKREGAELRIVSGDEYCVSCNVCNVATELKNYPHPPTSSGMYGTS